MSATNLCMLHRIRRLVNIERVRHVVNRAYLVDSVD